MYRDIGRFPTLSGPEARALQSFLSARGYTLGRIDGIAGPRTTRALQSFLREKIDATVQVDGVWGPQTARAFADSIAGMLGVAEEPSQGRVRLVMHTSARKRSDFYTFEREAMRLATDYQRHFPGDQVRRLLVRSGREIVQAINACRPGSILSWDVLSHTNFGGIHISNDLAAPRRASSQRQQRHLHHRGRGPNRQTAKDAMFMEEELRGLYTSPDVARTVADYFNQDVAHGVAYLREIQFDRFADECYVELHGCRTADRSTPLDRYFDAFIVRVSEDLPCDATMIGHVNQSSPRGNDGYRHGKVAVYQGGREVLTGRREELKFPNSSTPGDGPRDEGGACGPRDDWQPPPEPPRKKRRVPSWVTRPPEHDETPPQDEPERPRTRRDETPPKKREVPWGAIIGGAAAVGTLIYNNRKDRRKRDHDRNDRNDRNRRDHDRDRDRGASSVLRQLPYGGFGRFGRTR